MSQLFLFCLYLYSFIKQAAVFLFIIVLIIFFIYWLDCAMDMDDKINYKPFLYIIAILTFHIVMPNYKTIIKYKFYNKSEAIQQQEIKKIESTLINIKINIK